MSARASLGALARLLRDPHGPLTRELVRTPGRFGLGQVPERLSPDAVGRAVCGFCSTGCGLQVHMREGRAVNLSPDPSYPVNLGMACPKGWEALTPLSSPDRATMPLMRNPSGDLVPIDWDTALDNFVVRMRDTLTKHGPGSVAFLSSGQIVSEEIALLGVLAKTGMGMIHGDANTRQCMATSVVAYKECFGFDAPPFSYADFEETDLAIFVGANPCVAHPILWERMCRNPRSPRIVVIDPRRTETAQAASEHLPLRPKSDLPLLYAIAHVLVREGWLADDFIAAHTTGFAAFAEHVRAFDPASVEETTGIPAARIEALARSLHESERAAIFWTMGVNQSHEGVRTAQAIIALCLMTGQIGRPGTGPCSITGQCNAMGSRLFSNTTNLIGGHSFEKPAHREKVARILGVEEPSLPTGPGLPYDGILDAVRDGKIRALWVIGTNPAHSWINRGELASILDKLDFLVVQDMYKTTETAQLADLVLPAAGWGEKEGTFINSERRVGAIKQLARAPGQALSDFRIFKLIAEAWGCGDMLARWESPEHTFQIMKELTEGQPCDISGIDDYAMLDRHGGVQWPLPAGQAATPRAERRLFADGRFFTDDGRARFICEAPRPMPEPSDDDYPFTLLTGRGSSAQWHTNTRTGKSPVLRSLSPKDSYVELSPVDAKRLEIEPDSWVTVRSRRGHVRARAFVTHVVQPGMLFMPMHDVGTNLLTYPSFDPYSRQPSYKACAVRVERG